MDWQTMIEAARGQGPGFWMAAGAVALGATLLLVSLAMGLKRVLAGRSAATPTMPAQATADADVATAATDQAVEAYAAQQGSAVADVAVKPTMPPTAGAAGNDSLALLLRRLQSAGDRLEQIAEDLTPDQLASGDGAAGSALKSEFQEVEYVFRASGA
jgi:hypothetical protein